MEAKLLEFRARKRREELLNKPKEFFQVMKQNLEAFNLGSSNNIDPSFPTECGIQDDDISITSSNFSSDFPCQSWSCYRIFTYLLYVTLWITVFFIAVHLEFGFVYGILFGLVFLYFNTRTGPKIEGEISAYSVFNQNCESIHGTLKAEQFEREFGFIRHEPHSPDSNKS